MMEQGPSSHWYGRMQNFDVFKDADDGLYNSVREFISAYNQKYFFRFGHDYQLPEEWIV